MELLSRDALTQCLLAQAALTASGEPLSTTLPMALGWLRALWDGGDDHLPLDLVHDLGLLLLRGRDFRFGVPAGTDDDPEARADRLAYTDRVLGRWALDPSVQEAQVIVAGLPPAERDAAVVHALRLALGRAYAHDDDVPRGNPAHLRAMLTAGDALPGDRGALSARVDPAWRAWARAQRQQHLERLGAGRLLSRDALWEIEHLPDLPNESTRLALRQILAAADAVPPVSPAVLARLHSPVREVAREANTADAYPAGGFDAVSTRGTFENLMRSEVAYVGEGRTAPDAPDLFDMRFAEGELLYYTRDESPLFDARRAVTVLIDRPAAQRTKVAALPAQTLVLVEGTALALQRDLARAFGPTGSTLALVWRTPTAADRAVAAEEMGLLRLRLAAEVEHRRVRLVVADTWAEAPAEGRVVLSPDPVDPDARAALWVCVGGALWTVGDTAYDPRPEPEAGHGAGQGLRALLDAALRVATVTGAGDP
jgi:hypothetical protein